MTISSTASFSHLEMTLQLRMNLLKDAHCCLRRTTRWRQDSCLSPWTILIFTGQVTTTMSFSGVNLPMLCQCQDATQSVKVGHPVAVDTSFRNVIELHDKKWLLYVPYSRLHYPNRTQRQPASQVQPTCTCPRKAVGIAGGHQDLLILLGTAKTQTTQYLMTSSNHSAKP